MARTIAAALVLAWAGVAGAAAHVRVISAAACTTIAGPQPIADWALWQDNAVEAAFTSTTTTVLFCDAALPADATGFDYADFMYLWNSNAGDVVGPSAAAYVDVRVVAGDGTMYPVTVETGECTATVDFQSNLGNGICQVAGNASFVDGNGNPISRSPVSVHFLIFLPVTNDYSDNEAVQLFVHYEGP